MEPSAPIPAARRGSGRRGRAARLGAWAILVVGLATSVAVGTWLRDGVESDREAGFRSTAADIAGQVSADLRRDMDLTATARMLAALAPRVSSADMHEWSDRIGSRERHPEALGFEYIARVPRSELEAHEAAVRDIPLPEAPPFDADAVVPAGDSSSVCLTQAIELHGTASHIQQVSPATMAQLDWCSTGFGAALERASGDGDVVVVSAQAMVLDAMATVNPGLDPSATGLAWLDALDRAIVVFAPVYEGGGTPATAPERRAALQGWLGAAFDVGLFVDAAVAGRDGWDVTVSRQDDAGAIAIGTAGAARSHRYATDVPVDADGRWTVTVAGAAVVGGAGSGTYGALVIGGGSVVALLLFALLRVLARARDRALDLVDRTTAELRRQALHDSLTDLPNRALVLDRAEQLLARARRARTKVAVLFVDLDHFKDINDTLGHAAGDQLLTAVASRFQAALRSADTVGRLGGDEFVVVVEGESLAGGPDLVAQRLLDVLGEPFSLGDLGTKYSVTASIGVAVGDRATAQELLRDADIALYEAKDAGRNRYVLFERQMQEDVDSRTELDRELRLALERDQFVLHYQPTFGIRDAATTGVEALLRWDHPGRGLVAPGDFLPMLEANGLIVPVGRWVLHEACRQGAAWHDAGYPVVMSVNAAARQLEAPTFVCDVADALAATGFRPDHLVVEITESSLMRDAAGTVERLRELKALGVRVAIDDFGTGYSSLAYLRQFPVDILKIDATFIADVTRSDEAAALVHTLIQLGKSLGLETVAEGIEELDQLAALRDEDCDTGQGYLVSRPLPADELFAHLARTAAVPASK